MIFNIKLDGREILFAGGGKVAERKIKKLLIENTHITVIAPKTTDYIDNLGKMGKINIIKRDINVNDIKNNYFMVICATDNSEVNEEIANICKERHILHDDTGNHASSDIMMVASTEINGITLAISTYGNNPATAKKLKDCLENDLISNGYEFENYIKIIYKKQI